MPEVLWTVDFSSAEPNGFVLLDEPRYESGIDGTGLFIRTKKSQLFAWSESALYRYADASIDAELAMPAKGAAGLLVRMASDDSFVTILINAAGFVRMDAVFNGEPRTVIPWLRCPWLEGARSALMHVVMRGSRYVLFVNGRWAFDADEDSLEAGYLAFAAQSFDSDGETFTLRSLSVESRPLEVEVDYARLGKLMARAPEQERRLAETLFSSGYVLPALIHAKRLAEANNPKPEDLFLAAECMLRLDMLDEAAATLESCLTLAPSMREAREERLNLLYLKGSYLELRDAILAEGKLLEGNPRLWNLLGHAHYNLGAWKCAAEAYGRAADDDTAMPIYRLNLARSLEKADDPSGAAEAWLLAALGFFDQEAWDDAAACSTRLRELKYDAAALDSLDGRIAYARGDMAAAENHFAKLSRKKNLDAPSAYLYGLILNARGERRKALPLFMRAAELSPGERLYEIGRAHV